MSPFRKRWMNNNMGDIYYDFWSFHLIRKRFAKGLDESGRKLYTVPNGRIIFTAAALLQLSCITNSNITNCVDLSPPIPSNTISLSQELINNGTRDFNLQAYPSRSNSYGNVHLFNRD
jgi:hypothetical protein